MPLYEYQCDKCGETFEIIQKFSDEPLKLHETCGGAVHRLLSPPALQFKGSGWYITDYAKDSGSKSNGSANKSESKDAKSSTDTSSAGSSPETKAGSTPTSSSETK
jgi:putative FmdB family regulatory protein